VALAHLRDVVAAEPDEVVLGPVVARLQQTAIREERAGLDRGLVTLADPRYLRLLDDLYALMEEPPFTDRAGDPIRPVLRGALRSSVKRLRNHLATARSAPDAERAEALHAVRKAAKRVRYAAETGTGALGPAKPLVKAAKKIQTVLGDVQDTVLTRELCRRFGVVAFADGENAFTYGRLHALEQARAERGEQAFWELEPKVDATLKRAAR
jgi:CHAD domain-containing protein